MTDRIIDIAETAAYLRIENRRLVIEPKGGVESAAVPLEETAVLLLSQGGSTLTQAVMADLPAAGGVIVACDKNYMPASMTIPYVGHYLHSERLRRQLEASEAAKKRFWQQIVQSKIAHQGEALRRRYGGAQDFEFYRAKVRSGDPANIEGQVAKRYWASLFREHPDFTRDYTGDGINALLNYGYTVLRAMTARAICANGLHPACGLHHRNRYNAFCLADDLMEPFRPLVDIAVERLAANGDRAQLNRQSKQTLIEALTASVNLNGEHVRVFEALQRLCASLVNGFGRSNAKLALPERLWVNK